MYIYDHFSYSVRVTEIREFFHINVYQSFKNFDLLSSFRTFFMNFEKYLISWFSRLFQIVDCLLKLLFPLRRCLDS